MKFVIAIMICLFSFSAFAQVPPSDYTPRYQAVLSANIYAKKGWTAPSYFGSYPSKDACMADARRVQDMYKKYLEQKLRMKLVNRQNFHSIVSCELIDDTIESDDECDGC